MFVAFVQIPHIAFNMQFSSPAAPCVSWYLRRDVLDVGDEQQ